MVGEEKSSCDDCSTEMEERRPEKASARIVGGVSSSPGSTAKHLTASGSRKLAKRRGKGSLRKEVAIAAEVEALNNPSPLLLTVEKETQLPAPSEIAVFMD